MPEQKAKHTLFSFATLRSPQLLSDEAKDLFFIHYRENNESTMALSSGGSFEEHKNAVISMIGNDLYSFSEWLIRNRATAELRLDYYKGAGLPSPASGSAVNTVWKALFAALKEEDYPMQDFLQQILIANHYLLNAGEGTDLKALAFSKVVVPTDKAADISPVTENPLRADENFNPVSLRKQVNVLQAKEKIRSLQALLPVIQKLKTDYEAANERKYLEQRKAYDLQTEATWKTHRANNAENFSGVESLDRPDLPGFSFAPEAVNFRSDDFLNKIPASLRPSIHTVLTHTVDTYGDVIDTINGQIHEQTGVIFNNTDLDHEVVIAGGQVLPAAPGGADSPLYSYVAELVNTGADTYKVVIALNTGRPNILATATNYSAFVNGSDGTYTAFEQQSYSRVLMLSLFLNNEIDNTDLPITVTGTVRLPVTGDLAFRCFLDKQTSASGIMLPETHEEDGGGNPGGTPGNGGTGNGETTGSVTIYGVKRAGIADYRKVEQEVCCWDMGEVSHIENIMAREYKERSTRRLRRSEDTITSETSRESESMTDSSSTSRFEMQQQVAQAINESTSIGVNASVTFGPKLNQSTLSGSYANNTSQQQSNSQAVQLSKEITQKATEKIVNKVREERISKIIDEFEEQNKHGFDNREGDQHVSSVFRWIDKIYKNQVFNYGKRLMYEFMIPQPAVFHNAAMKSLSGTSGMNLLKKPADPRTFSDADLALTDYTKISEANYKYWAALYKADVDPLKENEIIIGKSFDHYTSASNEGSAKSAVISVPEGYMTRKALIIFGGMAAGGGWDQKIIATVGNRAIQSVPGRIDEVGQQFFDIQPFSKEVPVAVNFCNFHLGSVNISVKCILTDAAKKEWQMETFNAIIKAYEERLAEYERARAETAVGTNPGFYRTIENAVLRKNCIEYITKSNEMGQKQFTGLDVQDIKVNNTAAMEQYASLVKFMEQAFEWEILSYSFYPFYWADKKDWQNNYQQDVDDPIFRAFLQSGMARAMVSVRPGFEEAVMYYMATGKVWNGGEPPVIGDDLYLSIVEELKHPEYYIEETWETRVPTTLNIIQNGSVSAEANGLPCDCGDDNGLAKTDVLLKRLPAES